MLPASVLEEVGGLDPTAIAQVRAEAWPDVRDADELHDVLHTLVTLPVNEPDGDFEVATGVTDAQQIKEVIEPLVLGENSSAPLNQKAQPTGLRPSEDAIGVKWRAYFDRLVRERRAAIATLGADRSPRKYWVAAERAQSFEKLFPDAKFVPQPAHVDAAALSRDDALLTMVTGWMSHLGPVTASQLGETLGLTASDIEQALLRMEAGGPCCGETLPALPRGKSLP